MSKQDTLHSIADRFDLVPSTVMKIVNVTLYIIIYKLKSKYIFWPKNEVEYQEVISGFVNYPGKYITRIFKQFHKNSYQLF